MDTKELAEKINLDESSGNVSSALSARLIEMIVRKELPGNYIFPGENIFCEALGISRGTLREAYKVLESEGYIDRSRRGTFVKSQSEIPQIISLSTAMHISDFNDLMEFRSVFESANARLSALRADESDIATLEYYLAMMKANCEDIKKLTYYDMKFHLELANITKNWLLRTTMEAAENIFSKGIYNAFEKDTEINVKRALMYHESIISAIKKRDAVEAERLMTEHLSNISSRGMVD